MPGRDNYMYGDPVAMHSAASIFGLKYVESVEGTTDYVLIQFRFPRSKKKRIRRKWKHKRRNLHKKEVYRTFFHRPSGTLFIHPKMLKQVEEAMLRDNAKRMRDAVDAMSFSAMTGKRLKEQKEFWPELTKRIEKGLDSFLTDPKGMLYDPTPPGKNLSFIPPKEGLNLENLLDVRDEMMQEATRTFAMPGLLNPTFDRIEPEAKKRKRFLTEYGGFNIVR